MVRTRVGRRHDVIDFYAPSGQEHNDLELRRYNKPWELAAVVNEAFQPSAEYRENPAS